MYNEQKQVSGDTRRRHSIKKHQSDGPRAVTVANCDTDLFLCAMSLITCLTNEFPYSLSNEGVKITQGLVSARQVLYHEAKRPFYPHIPLNTSKAHNPS